MSRTRDRQLQEEIGYLWAELRIVNAELRQLRAEVGIPEDEAPGSPTKIAGRHPLRPDPGISERLP